MSREQIHVRLCAIIIRLIIQVYKPTERKLLYSIALVSVVLLIKTEA
jgi:hypothetical protein